MRRLAISEQFRVVGPQSHLWSVHRLSQLRIHVTIDSYYSKIQQQQPSLKENNQCMDCIVIIRRNLCPSIDFIDCVNYHRHIELSLFLCVYIEL